MENKNRVAFKDIKNNRILSGYQLTKDNLNFIKEYYGDEYHIEKTEHNSLIVNALPNYNIDNELQIGDYFVDFYKKIDVDKWESGAYGLTDKYCEENNIEKLVGTQVVVLTPENGQEIADIAYDVFEVDLGTQIKPGDKHYDKLGDCLLSIGFCSEYGAIFKLDGSYEVTLDYDNNKISIKNLKQTENETNNQN